MGPTGVEHLFVMDSLMTDVGYMEVAGSLWFVGPLDEHWSCNGKLGVHWYNILDKVA